LDKKSIAEPGRLSEKHWKSVLLSMPIPCVDVIVEKQSKVLLGFRVIDPYRNVWALPGGRILKHENPENTVRRTLKEINITAKIKSLVGVFPVRFPRHPLKRYDITLCYRSEWIAGEPKPNAEQIRFRWFTPRRLSTATGGNYKKMIQYAYR